MCCAAVEHVNATSSFPTVPKPLTQHTHGETEEGREEEMEAKKERMEGGLEKLQTAENWKSRNT